jgi:hypothetical protein
MDRTENVSSIIICSLVTGETTCSQSCSLATAVVLSPVYTTVTWHWVYIAQYKCRDDDDDDGGGGGDGDGDSDADDECILMCDRDLRYLHASDDKVINVS